MNGTEKFEARVQPELDRVKDPNELIIRGGYAMVLASTGTRMLLGAGSAFMTKHYWVTLTDRRVIVLALKGVGTRAEFEAAADLSEVRIDHFKSGLLGSQLQLILGQKTYNFKFPIQFKGTAQALASRLGVAA